MHVGHLKIHNNITEVNEIHNIRKCVGITSFALSGIVVGFASRSMYIMD